MLLLLDAGDITMSYGRELAQALCRSPAAQQLSCSFIKRCLTLLCYKCSYDETLGVMSCIISLEPAQALSVAAVEKLLNSALFYENYKATLLLLNLTAAQQLDTQAVCRLLRQAYTLYMEERSGVHPSVISVLLDLPAAADVPAEAAVAILRRAIRVGSDQDTQVLDTLPWLCTKFIKLDAGNLVQLITTTDLRDVFDIDRWVEVICCLLAAPAAQQLSADHLLRVLAFLAPQAAGEQHHEKQLVSAIAALPAAQQREQATEAQHQLLLLVIKERWQLMAQTLLTVSVPSTCQHQM